MINPYVLRLQLWKDKENCKSDVIYSLEVSAGFVAYIMSLLLNVFLVESYVSCAFDPGGGFKTLLFTKDVFKICTASTLEIKTYMHDLFAF